jgi:hypothetical protein
LEIDRLFDQDGQTGDPTPLIAICGDFNAKKRRGPPQAICGQVEDSGNPAHGPRVMVACETRWPSRPDTHCSIWAKAR